MESGLRIALRVVAFCTVFLLGNEGLRHAHNAALRVWLQDTYTESSRLHYRDPCRIAFIGDSIFLTGLDPSVIPNSYNFAWLDANYLSNYFTLRWMLRAHPENLDVIVLPLDRHSFAARRLDGNMLFNKASFADAFSADHHDRQRGRYLRMYIRDRAFPYADLPGYWADNRNEVRPAFHDGFLLHTNQAARGPEAFARSAALRGRQMFRGEAPLDDRLVSHLDAILQTAKDHGLNVLLVQCPVSQEFDDELRKHVSDREFDALKNSIVSDHPEVKVLDVRDRFLDRREYFVDANHLNPDGARAFSVLVRDELQRLGYNTP